MQAQADAQSVEILKEILEQLQKLNVNTSHLHSDLTRIATRAPQ